MTDFYSDEVQRAYRSYIEYERALQVLGDYTVPVGEMNAFLSAVPQEPRDEHSSVIRGGGPLIQAFIHQRTFFAFAQLVLGSDESPRVMHVYSHDPHAEPSSEAHYIGEQQLHRAMSAAAGAFRIAPDDLVLVHGVSFKGDLEALQRVLHATTQTGALVFVDQFGILNPIDSASLEEWFEADDRMYVPVKRSLLDGLYRPILPTGPGSWG